MIPNSDKKDTQNPIVQDALEKIKLGYKVLPCTGKVPSNKIKSVSKVREKPIHAGNADFYFSEATDIAILTGDKLEALDLDLKNDNSGTLKNNFLSAIKFALPDVYERLVIEKSPSGGLHVYYKCNQIGGSQALACRPSTNEELAKGERKKVLIETKGEGSQINCAQSPGYELIQGDFADIAFITPEERALLHAIARSFDKVVQPELKGIHSSLKIKGDSPWVEFNKKHGWEWMTQELCSSGFSKVREDEYRVYLLRDGSSAKTSGAIWKESNTLYLFSTSTEFEAEKPYSAFGILCQLKYDGKLQACAADLADQGIGIWSWSEGEFYTIGHRSKVEFKYKEILQWLHDIGMRKYFYSDGDFFIVQVVGNKVKLVTIDRIKKLFGDYISNTLPDKILNSFIKHMVSLFTKEGLISQLNDLSEDSFVRCTAETGWIYFQNGALRISIDEKQLIPYENLPGYVWEKNIVKRNFVPGPRDCDPKAFIKLLAGDRVDMEHRYRLVVGYLLHLYKDPVDPKVVILNDEFYDDLKEAEPQGGTGKGLFIKLIKQFLRALSIDGKRFDLKRNFAFQGITPDTQIMIIEDAMRGFCFETLFSSITEGIVVEKKGKDEYRIPYERSPKILITTNYAIKGNSSSHLRRRYELEVAPFFSHKVRPVDYFGKRFFEDWSELEWLAFDNYMVDCLQLFLNEGLPEQITINLEKKKVIQASSKDFFSWIENLYTQEGIPETTVKAEFMEKFTRLYPDYAYGKLKISQTKFTQWLERWCSYREINLDASQMYNGAMTYKFKGVLKSEEKLGENFHEVFLNGVSEKFVNNGFEIKSSWKPVVDEELF